MLREQASYAGHVGLTRKLPEALRVFGIRFSILVSKMKKGEERIENTFREVKPPKSCKTLMIPTTGRIIETCLYVADVDRATDWYRQIFGFPCIFQDDRLRALQVAQDQVLLLFKQKGSLTPTVVPGGTIPPHDGSGPMHIAFAMQTAEVDDWETHLAKHGVAIESRVHWGGNDKSLYFRDPDGHTLELISGDHWRRLANG